MLAMLLLLVLIAAWYDGGERTIRPIVEDVAVPEGVL